MTWTFNNSPGVAVSDVTDDRFTVATEGQDDHVRVVLDVPRSDGAVDIDIRLAIEVHEGSVTHLALVNATGSESRMIDLTEFDGPTEFMIGGILRDAGGHVLLLLILKGPTRASVTLLGMTIDRIGLDVGCRVLFFIDPWIERDNAFSKELYLPWFATQARALGSADAGYEFLVVGNEALAGGLACRQAGLPFRGIPQERLLEIFPGSRDALTRWCTDSASPAQTRAMQDLVATATGEFVPDIILATAPAPYLGSQFPRAMLLHTDGFHFRPPWPDGTPMLDPFGSLFGTAVESMAKSAGPDPTARRFMTRYREIVDGDSRELNRYVSDRVGEIRRRFGTVVVLALQDIDFFNLFCVRSYGTTIDHVIDVMRRVDPTIGVIIAQHPDRQTITAQSMEWLESKFPNLVSDRSLNELKAPTQALLPHVDGMVTTSSGLIYQAAIRHKPAFLTHSTHFSAMAHTRPLESINDAAPFRIDADRVDAEMAWILRHHAFNHAFMLHTAWLHDRLRRMLDTFRGGRLSIRSMPRIASDATILGWLGRHVRPGIDASPPSARGIEARERRKYETMYKQPEYHGNDSVVATARRLVDEFHLTPPSTILDVGCGPGSASMHLKSAGHDVVAVDIAANCLDEDKRGKFPLLITCIWELPDFVRADVFLCADVMEHIPPDHVTATLAKLAGCCRRGGLLVISLRDDDCGRLIGERLHLTVRQAEWWERTLGTHWRDVRILDHDLEERHATFRVAHA